MIDTRHESLLPLVEVGELVRKHVATVYRWTTTGYRGVILETLQVGGTRCSSHEAVQRFCERITQAESGARRRPRQVSGGSQNAAQELERHGV